MVQLMKSSKLSPESLLQQRGKMVQVKREVDDSFDHRHALINKRSKQNELEIGGFPVPPAEFNPLDEPSPLGLRLKKSPSLLDLIQMRLSKGNSSNTGTQAKKDNKGANTSLASDKLKASNFPATLLKIGTWEYKSRHEGDLVAKCYFAKHKLVWEVLDGGLKNKIEIQWSDIMALKANYPDDGPGTLDVVLTRHPLFFRETNPQPRKHTLWQATSDFTGGQASLHRRHYLQCAQGLLGKHFEKLTQCDPHLSYLSQQEAIVLESPCFEPRVSVFDDPSESNEYSINSDGGAVFDLHGAASPSGAQSSSSKSELHDTVARPTDFHQGTPSPSSDAVMDTAVTEEIRNGRVDEPRSLSRWDQIKVPGLHPSMSMSDLVNHIENRISEHRTSTNFTLSTEERESLEILEEISQCLMTDSQFTASTTDENSLMSRVNSLFCLLQKDPVTVQDLPGKVDNHVTDAMDDKRVNAPNYLPASVSGTKVEDSDIAKSENGECNIKKATGMSREDSVGELLMNLPRIASLPQFFFNM